MLSRRGSIGASGLRVRTARTNGTPRDQRRPMRNDPSDLPPISTRHARDEPGADDAQGVESCG